MNSTVEIKQTKKLVYIALLIATSFIGAQIKIFGSIALDALPAFFAALFIGPIAGALVGAIGHLLTAMTSGFPLTIPIHVVLTITMALICWTFGYLKNHINIILNGIIAILLNGVVAAFITVRVMFILGIVPSVAEPFIALVGPLAIASTVNVALAAILYKVIKNRIL